MLGDLIFLTSLALDPDNADKVAALGLPMGLPTDPDFPLTAAEFRLLGEGGESIPGVESAGLHLSYSVLWRGVKCACPSVEFHFRNDATRPMYGTPITLEEHLPERSFQIAQAAQLLAKALAFTPIGGCAELEFDALDPQDRHILYIVILSFPLIGSSTLWVFAVTKCSLLSCGACCLT